MILDGWSMLVIFSLDDNNHTTTPRPQQIPKFIPGWQSATRDWHVLITCTSCFQDVEQI
jgi:hypothetical protein